MTQGHDSVILAEMLASNEEVVGRLYQACAKKYPECEDFWTGLAVDEKTHADWIRQLAGQVGEGRIHIEPGRFKKEAIESFGKYVQEEISRIKGSDLPLITALSIALDIEKSVMESNFFEIFATDSEELKHVLHDLAEATEEHVKRVEECWAHYRSKL